MAGKIKYDLTGLRFGRWVVLKYLGSETWLCKCDCGTVKKVKGRNLREGESLSCGCLHKEIVGKNSTTHGKSKTRLYKIWCNMKCRCYTPSSTKYEMYGGRGISVCNEWKANFMNFYVWAMANGYRDDLSIDRINSDGNYEPNNCRWATYKVQGNNTNQNHVITFKGKSQTLAEWADELGFSYKVLSERIRRRWSIKRALTTPTQFKNSEVHDATIKAISA